MRGLGKLALFLGVILQVISLATFYSPRSNALSASNSILTTSPVSIDVSGQPGHSVSTDLYVQNNAQQTVTVGVRLQKFKSNGQDGHASIFKPTVGDPSISWVHFSQNSFMAVPGVWNKVTMTVDLPQEASLGYYYAILFVPTIPSVLTSNTNSVKSANAIFVLVDTNSKNEQKQLRIADFSSQRGLYQFLPAKFNIKVKNNGNIHLVPAGDVYISRTKHGKSISTIDINSGQGNVLPNSSRTFQVEWTNGFPSYQVKKIDGQIVSDSKGRPIEQLNWNFSTSLSQFRFGKYYAHLGLVYSNGTVDVPVDSYVSFWVITWELIMIFIVGIVALIFGWKLFKKSFKKLWRKIFIKK